MNILCLPHQRQASVLKKSIKVKGIIDYRWFFWYTNCKQFAIKAKTNREVKNMAENKQYITNTQDNGSVMISEDVITAIVSHAVSEVDGVVSISSKPVAELADMIGKKWGKGMRIAISENNDVIIDVDVTIGYGQSVVSIAGAVQSAIIGAVQSMTGVENVTVNVNVCGIAR